MLALTVPALKVASLADAWIETQALTEFISRKNVASLADAWIETSLPRAGHCLGRRVPRGRVD